MPASSTKCRKAAGTEISTTSSFFSVQHKAFVQMAYVVYAAQHLSGIAVVHQLYDLWAVLSS